MFLSEYLDSRNESLRGFAGRTGLSLETVRRIANGTQVNITLKTLSAIETATDGQVTREDFDKQIRQSA